MDEIDRRIFGLLQDDGRITVTQLSERIGLSLSATSERLRQLTRSPAIRKFTAVVNAAEIGRPIEALIDVRLPVGAAHGALDEVLAGLEAVVDAVHLTGRFDLQLRVAAADVGELDRLLMELKETHGAEETNTRLVLRTIDGFPRSAVPA